MTSEYEFLHCFYDTQDMRDRYPDNYPNHWWTKTIIPSNEIICRRVMGLFGTTFIHVLKNLPYEDRNLEIRRQMEIKSVYVSSE